MSNSKNQISAIKKTQSIAKLIREKNSQITYLRSLTLAGRLYRKRRNDKLTEIVKEIDDIVEDEIEIMKQVKETKKKLKEDKKKLGDKFVPFKGDIFYETDKKHRKEKKVKKAQLH